MFGHTLFTRYISLLVFSLHWRKNLNNNVILCLFGANLRDIRDIITIDEDEYLIQSKQRSWSQKLKNRFSVSDLSSLGSQKIVFLKTKRIKAIQRVTNDLFKALYYHSMVHHLDMNMDSSVFMGFSSDTFFFHRND